MQWTLIFIFSALFLFILSTQWLINSRKYESVKSVASSYDSWTNDRLLENLWGDHIHLGYYEKPRWMCSPQRFSSKRSLVQESYEDATLLTDSYFRLFFNHEPQTTNKKRLLNKRINIHCIISY